MARSYLYECSRCGYQAKVSGRADQGVDLLVQTILCRDCREILDAVTHLRLPSAILNSCAWKSKPPIQPSSSLEFLPNRPPPFLTALARLPARDISRHRWVEFPLQCPNSARHRIRPWKDPDLCPRCGTHLEKTGLPYRVWD